MKSTNNFIKGSGKMKQLFQFIIAAVLMLTPLLNGQALPTDIVIQGVLRDQQNRAVVDGEYTMTFSLYILKEGGSPVWTSLPIGVMVQNGVFSVRLNEFNANVTFRTQYFAGITVIGMGSELTPRLELGAVPNAMAIRGGNNIIAGAGNVGIGVLNPSQRLEVDGNLKISGNVILSDSLSIGSKIRFKEANSGIYDEYNKTLLVQSSSANEGDRLVLSHGGNHDTTYSFEVNTEHGLETGNNTPLIIQNSEWGSGLKFSSALGGAMSEDNFYISRGGQDANKNDLIVHVDEQSGSRLNLMSTGGKSIMTILGNSGAVGIGKTPHQNSKLDVAGSIYMQGASPIVYAEFTATGNWVEVNTNYSADVWIGVFAGLNAGDFDLNENGGAPAEQYCYVKTGTIWVKSYMPAHGGNPVQRMHVMFIKKELVNGSMPTN